MSLIEDKSQATYQIQSYSPDGAVINGEQYSKSLIISPDRLLPDWPVRDLDAINDQYLLQLLDFQPNIILLGTGLRSIIPPAKTLQVLLSRQFQVECMSTPAACRTYTVLAAEGRRVVAGLIL